MVQVGTIMGNSANFSENNVLFNPELINGYKFNRFIGLGGGIGLNLINQGALLPISLDIRGDLFEEKATLHYYAKGGYSLALYNRNDEIGWWGEPIIEDFKASGGLMTEAGLGVKIHGVSGIAWIISGGYRIQNLKESYTSWGETKIVEDYTFQRFTFNLGIMF